MNDLSQYTGIPWANEFYSCMLETISNTYTNGTFTFVPELSGDSLLAFEIAVNNINEGRPFSYSCIEIWIVIRHILKLSYDVTDISNISKCYYEFCKQIEPVLTNNIPGYIHKY